MRLDLSSRLKQLKNSSDLLSDALKSVESGDSKYLIVLGTQLRALICKGGRNFQPLLLDLAEELSFPLECFGPPNSNQTDPLFKGLVFRISGRIIGFEPFSPAQRKYFLKDWLDANILVVDGLFYTPNEVLRTFSDKEASHYDKNSDDKIDKLKEIIHHNYFKGGNINEVDRFLIETATYIVTVSNNLLKQAK